MNYGSSCIWSQRVPLKDLARNVLGGELERSVEVADTRTWPRFGVVEVWLPWSFEVELVVLG